MLPSQLQRAEIVQTLKAFQNAGFKSAIIAGGAIRDLYFGQWIRDVDIFVHNPNMSNEKVGTLGDDFKTLVWQAMDCRNDTSNNPAPDNVQQRFHAYGDDDHKITHVFDVVKNWIPYQIVFTKIPPADHLNKYFDFGLCRCYCDGVKMRYTPAFMNDMHNKTLTLMADDMTEKEVIRSMMEHLPRLLWRFPNHSVRFTTEVKKIVDKIRKTP